MTVKIGINGFGRIGRSVLRASLESIYSNLEIVHINDLADSKVLTHLLKYDSVHGIVRDVHSDGAGFNVRGRAISVSAVRDPAEIPWAEKNVDIVFECTGLFQDKEKCEAHLKAGAKKVLISAPAKNEDLTVVYGVNSEQLKPEHKILSNGSCTTNCLAPLTKVIHDAFNIESGLMNTIHSLANANYFLMVVLILLNVKLDIRNNLQMIRK